MSAHTAEASFGRPRRLKVAIATGGRFHVLDLARELDALGHDVRFYSYVPTRRAVRFGLPMRCCVSILPAVTPYVAWARLLPKMKPALRERLLVGALNRAIIARLQPCDVFIGMSGLILEAAAYAKSEFGARVYLERGSQHILAQKEILADTGVALTRFSVERELAGYALADRISVPSSHVCESFRRDPVALAKLFVNPYGVDLQMFPAQECPINSRKTVLFVGGWIYRKGVDILVRAIEQLSNVQLIHVGKLGDVPFPDDPRFRHSNSVSQERLTHFYANADMFALASREEGLALVQAQALASGLPLVCTERTGGLDLGHSPQLERRIRIVPANDADALASAISATLKEEIRKIPLPEADRSLLSWRAYGERYASQLEY